MVVQSLDPRSIFDLIHAGVASMAFEMALWRSRRLGASELSNVNPAGGWPIAIAGQWSVSVVAVRSRRAPVDRLPR
jgi:hypothetical protein